MTSKKIKKSFAPAKLPMSVAVALVAMGSASALAFNIDTGNPDIVARWDNTVRYGLAWRMESINPAFANAYGGDETETTFKKHDLVQNRLDLLSEFDVVYKEKYGFRVSGSAWSENAYPSKPHTGDLINQTFTGPLAVPSNYGPDGRYSSYAKRYITGSSGEFLDAFVFGGFELGSTSLNVKLGQHNVFWGETMFSPVDGVSAGQGPMDFVKGASSPGAEVKELFLPINQISAQWQVTPEVSLMGQYLFDWKPFRFPTSGTFFTSGDGYGNLLGGDPMCAATGPAGTCIKSMAAITPGRNGGDYGLALRWSPDWLKGTAGFYYRKYDEKLPWAALQLQGGDPTNPNNLAMRLSYARDTEMFGVSLQRNFFDAYSVGLEASYRRNTALNSVAGFFAGSQPYSGTIAGFPSYFVVGPNNIPLSQTPSYSQVEGARGNTYHFVANVVTLLDKTFLYETGNLAAELAYQRLDKVTKNPNVYFAEGYACTNGFLASGILPGALNKSDSCATKDALVFNMGFNPQWMEVLPSLNLTMPISLSYGISGNAPTILGSTEGSYRWSVGLTANYKAIYEFGLLLSDSHNDYKTVTATAANGVPGQQIASVANDQRGGLLNSHRWLSLRFKTAF